MAYEVFISYSSKDKTTADAVTAALEQAGLRCWIAPRDITPGRDWAEAIIDAIEVCKVMVLVFSANANASPQIKKEVERAVNHGVPIIPFRIEMVLPSKSLEYFISTPHWLDAMSPPLEKHIQHLAGTIQRMLESPEKIERGQADEAVHQAAEKQKKLEFERQAKKKKLLLAGGIGAAVVVGGIVMLSTLGQNRDKGIPPSAKPSGEAELVQAQGLYEKHDLDGAIAAASEAIRLNPTLARAHLARGVAHLEACDYDQAIEDLTNALKIDSNLSECYGYRAFAFANNDDDASDERALADAEKAINTKSQMIYARAALATVYAAKSDEGNAMEEARQILEQDPKSAMGLMIRASLKMAQSTVSDMSDADEAMRIAPHSAVLRSTRAMLYWNQHKYAEAKADCDAALKSAPRCAFALAVRSLMYSSVKDYANSMRDCNEAIRLSPRRSLGYLARAIIQRDNNQIPQALADANRACALRPKWAFSLFIRASVVQFDNIDEALSDLGKSIAADPRFPASYMLRGMIYTNNKADHKAAAADFTTAITLRPNEPLFLRYRAEVLILLARYKEALDDIQAVLKLDPQDAVAMADRGAIHFGLKQTDLALEWYGKSLEKQKSAQAYKGRAYVNQALKNFDLAAADFSGALELDAKDAVGFYQRAQVYHLQQKLDLAIADLTAALKIEPKHEEFLSDRANLYVQTNQPEQALADFNTLVELAPENELYYFLRGRYYLGQKLYELAIADVTKSIKLDSKDADNHHLLGLILKEKGPAKSAIPSFIEAVKLEPQRIEFQRSLVTTYVAAEEFEAGRKALDDAIDANPTAGELIYFRATTRWEMGKPEEALLDCDALVRIAPKDASCFLLRGRIRAALNRHVEALDDFRAALALDKNSGDIYAYQGLSLEMIGKPDDALASFNDALRVDPKHFLARQQRSLSYFSQGKNSEALKDADQLVENYPKNVFALINRQLLRSRDGDAKGAAEDRANALLADPLIAGDKRVFAKRVLPGGQGDTLGILNGDELVSYNGIKLTRVTDLTTLVREPGTTEREVVIRRNGELKTFKAKPGRLGIMPEEQPFNPATQPTTVPATQK